MVTVALVPARGGSRGLPGKNLAPVGGRSLVGRAVDVAWAVGVDEVIVSSDDDAILSEGERAGATVTRRPAELASDEATTDAVVRHFLGERADVDVLVLLQPTSPLRDAGDVGRCLEALASAPAAATVAPAEHPAEWLFRVDERARLDPLLGWERMVARRQDAAPAYTLNGAVYAARADHLRAGGQLISPQTVAVPMPSERSVDVDDRVGLALARALCVPESAVVIFGGGGHARAVSDVVSRLGVRVAAVVDPSQAGGAGRGEPVVLVSDEDGARHAVEHHLPGVPAVGDNRRRTALVGRLAEAGVALPPVVAASATVAADARLDAGSVVMEHGHVGQGAVLGRGCLVNTAAVVEHDCVLGHGVHAGPGAVLGGGVRCGDGALVGAGAVVRPGTEIGSGATVGAGAAVVGPVAPGVTVAGVPARPLLNGSPEASAR